MATVHWLSQSFNAGELSPLMGQRFGVEKVASGCRRLRNFLLHVHGPAFRRPGMEYLGDAANDSSASSLIPFQFSTTTSAVLELHPDGLRVWQNGALVTLLNPVALPYAEAECPEVKWVQVNDVLYMAHANHQPRKLSRFADNDWRISEVPWKWPAMGDPSVVTTDQAPTSVVLMASPKEATGEFSAPDRTVTISMVNPLLDSTTKRLRLQHWNGFTWINDTSIAWTTSPPAPASFLTSRSDTQSRILYVGGVGPSGSQGVATWTEGTVIVPVGSVPELNTVTVPAGDWQATAICPSNVGGMTLSLERYTGSAWVTHYTFPLANGATLTYDGSILTVATQFRFVWTGGFEVSGKATIEQLIYPPALDVTVQSNGTTGTNRTLTASAPIFLPEHVGSYWQIGHRRALASVEIKGTGTTAASTIAATTTASILVSGAWQVLTYGFWTTTLYLERKRGTTWETLRSWVGNNDRNIAVDGTEDQIVELRLRCLAGTGKGATGADLPRFVLEALDPEIYGLVKIKAVGTLSSNGKSATATADIISPLYSTDATPIWEEGAWSDVRGFPRAVAIHGERLWFGGSRAEPMRLWGSVVADYEDFRRSTFDDAGVSFTAAASSSNPIQWMLSRDNELIFGTSGDEWTLGTESGPITPVNVLVQRRSGYGSEYVQAKLLGENVVFVQRGGRKLRAVPQRADTEPWVANDLTVLAEHIARDGIIQTAVMTAPFTILWCVTAAGKLLGMTFEQEQNVFGWHVHTTDGTVESVSVIRGDDIDEVWLTVLRDGSRFVERMDGLVFQRDFERRTEMIYTDAAKRFTFDTATDELTGLDHLDGQVVSVSGDGADLGLMTVTDGAVTLENAVNNAVVGLPFTSELQPMRMDIPLRDGTSQGRNFHVSRVYLTVEDSLGGEIGAHPDTNIWEPINYRLVSTPMNTAPALLTGEQETAIESRVRAGIDVIVRQKSPLPLNISSIVVKADIYGE